MNIRPYPGCIIAVVLACAALVLQGCSTVGGPELSGARGELVTAALSQVGTPYRLGGNSPREGLDCSGLTAYAHRAAGVKIPRRAVDQRRSAKSVGDRPAPGDLVFFRIPPGGEHVGLMVDGERFVHASTSRQQVRLSRLDSPYWRRYYAGAGTYLP